MEQKMVEIPFDLELAKKITSGEVEGSVKVRCGKSVRIVCFDRKFAKPIIALINTNGVEGFMAYDITGKADDRGEKDVYDLRLVVPEYFSFEHGDVVIDDNFKDIMYLIDRKGKKSNETSCYLLKYDYGSILYGQEDSICSLKGTRLATEEERSRFAEGLKRMKGVKAHSYLERFFGIKIEYKFKTFDKVLVREDFGKVWLASFFSHSCGNERMIYVTTDGSFYYQCIPYEGNEHLLGTTQNPEGYVVQK